MSLKPIEATKDSFSSAAAAVHTARFLVFTPPNHFLPHHQTFLFSPCQPFSRRQDLLYGWLYLNERFEQVNIVQNKRPDVGREKKESKKTRKHAFDQESDQEKKKKERKHALDQESDKK